MRDDIVINSTVKKKGNGWFIPITRVEKDLIGIEDGDDLEVRIIVRERRARERQP
jgi:hypothetical protein